MSGFPFYVVNAFTTEAFCGNPAGVIVVDDFLSDQMLKNLVKESHLPEVSFVRARPQSGEFDIRWFTSELELDLCGHGTVGAAHAIFNHIAPSLNDLTFYFADQQLVVSKVEQGYRLTFPSLVVELCQDETIKRAVEVAIGRPVKSLYQGRSYLAFIDNQRELEALAPIKDKLVALDLPGVIVVTDGDELDYVCRYFAPQKGIFEDAVTGTAHSTITTLLSKTHGAKRFNASQLSSRGGRLQAQLNDQGVELTCDGFTSLVGQIFY
ncbi:MAG: PhzF family phenazine biosynthesis protein [Reinekea sp.]